MSQASGQGVAQLPTMELVNSSNVAAVGYDPGNYTVFVAFLSGDIYRYPGVTKSEYEELKSAKSVGRHLSASFRDKHKAIKHAGKLSRADLEALLKAKTVKAEATSAALALLASLTGISFNDAVFF